MHKFGESDGESRLRDQPPHLEQIDINEQRLAEMNSVPDHPQQTQPSLSPLKQGFEGKRLSIPRPLRCRIVLEHTAIKLSNLSSS
ncbi:hypothetical protein T265_12195 [Opisthorchis viverrini]|uniref:Uncharacterized protein n=1 Tax=Opisthorchis viverrini TaxID=6198 RepID=A0A074YZQ0_OPIVI|nr:hypothetical protein T265_12195 [Opisthorchis viverrini]KER18672.1 hypothetical protein T265_12195 [Opisthorchis viverrini]